MSLISSITDYESNQLTVALIKAIDDAIRPGGDEPDIVARITVNVPTNLASMKRIGAYELAVGGIFVHQKPKVWFEDMSGQSIELGDLLVISSINTLDGKTSRKATLYQAKMFNSFPIKEPKNEYQHDLYRDWPIFMYVHAELKGKKRWLNGYNLYDAAKYLLLRKPASPPSGWPNWIHARITASNALTAHPTSPLSHYQCFINELFHLVLSDAGKSFEVLTDDQYEFLSDRHMYCCDGYPFCCCLVRHPYGCDFKLMGWDLMINDLLKTISLKKTKAMGRASSLGNTPANRGVNITGYKALMDSDSTLKNFLIMEGSDDFPPNINQRGPGDEEPEGGGISVIEFVLTESENPQEIRPDEHAE